MSDTFQGKIKRINRESGMGVIIRDGDGEKVRLHFSHMVGPTFKTLAEGDTVAFECEDGRRGPEARKVVKLEA